MADAAVIAEYGFDPDSLCGWAGEPRMRADWPRMQALRHNGRPVFQDWPGIKGDLKRTTAWDVLKQVGDHAVRQVFRRYQEIGDCVAWGAAKAAMSTAAHEIHVTGDREKWHPIYEPYIYGISRCAREGGNGQLGRSDGSLGSWVAATIVIYGALRADFDAVPPYSGSVAKQWGACRGYDQFIPEAKQHIFKRCAPIQSAQQLAEAICNGYFCSVAGNRQFPSRLSAKGDKGFYEGGSRYPHQTSFLAFDPADGGAFYDSNQWPSHAVGQTDGPDGGGWRTWDYVDRELRSNSVECFAFSQFDGFPSLDDKPDFRI